MYLSIIYVNYKTTDLIVQSIHSLKEKTQGIEYEIIVVDNQSGDDPEAQIRSIFPEIIFIQSPENVGFGRANNLGISVAKGTYLFFLNPDTILLNNAIKILSDFLACHKNVGACGGNLVDENHCPTNSFGRKDASFLHEFLDIFYIRLPSFPHPRSSFYNFTKKSMNVTAIVGANLMVKKKVLDEVGVFDPAFFMNGEEVDLCSRIRKQGYSVFSVPEAEIMHFEGRSQYISASRLQLLTESQFITYKKKYGDKGPNALFRIYLLKCNLRYSLFAILRMKNKQEYWKNKKKIIIRSFQHFLSQS